MSELNKITAFGESLTLSEWSIRTGLEKYIIYQRIHTLKWSAEKAVSVKKGEDKYKAIWMLVSRDAFSLPEIVAESIEELSTLSGYSIKYIRNHIYSVRAGRAKERFVKVTFKGDEEDE